MLPGNTGRRNAGPRRANPAPVGTRNISPRKPVILPPYDDDETGGDFYECEVGGVGAAEHLPADEQPSVAEGGAVAEVLAPVGDQLAAAVPREEHLDRAAIGDDVPTGDEPPPAGVDDEPGGLTWDQLTDLVMALFAGPVSCVGGSLAIYDPDQDPDGSGAAQIVAFVRNVLVRPTISP